MRDFTDLAVWQRAYKLALDVYEVTAAFAIAEKYGLTAQLRRCSVSVAANIAEGSKKRSQADFARFLNIAEGSAAETQCLLMFARDLAFIPQERAGVLLKEIDEISRMLNALRSKVESQ